MARRSAADTAYANATKDGPVMVCVGGPLNGRWYSEKGWKALQDSETAMLPTEDREPCIGLYQRTSDQRDNPGIQGLRGTSWRWTGPVEEAPTRGRPQQQRSPY